MMNGGDIKKAAINKAKQVASAAKDTANGSGGKKRRKGTDLKPIITTDGVQSAEASPITATNPNNLRLVYTINRSALSSTDILQRGERRTTNEPPEEQSIVIILIVWR
jgi:hypothetical protein